MVSKLQRDGDWVSNENQVNNQHQHDINSLNTHFNQLSNAIIFTIVSFESHVICSNTLYITYM